jgi:hypothetical protein
VSVHQRFWPFWLLDLLQTPVTAALLSWLRPLLSSSQLPLHPLIGKILSSLFFFRICFAISDFCLFA